MSIEDTNAQGAYNRLESKREHYLDRARESALVTIPSLMPPNGFNSSQRLPTPFQSLGERGVRNLASKLLLILFPPGAPSFELGIKPEELEVNDEITVGAAGEALSRLERSIVREQEATTIRVRAFEMLKQLISSGNVLVKLNNQGSFRVFKLTNYVCRRSANGIPEIIILKQMVSPRSLPEEFTSAVPNNHDPNKDLELYTVIRRADDNSQWEIHQELEQTRLLGTEAFEPIDQPSWLPLRMEAIDGEDYGRGFVEGILGDMNSYDALSQHLLDGAAISSRTVPLIRPGAVTKARDFEKPNLTPIIGNPEDVSFLRVEKQNDYGFAIQFYLEIQKRLESAFLLNASIQRNAERVTAEEIRFMAGELDQALGGVYSTLAQEFQRPFVRWQLFRLIRENRVDPEAINLLDIKITTGLQTLGRGTELVNLRGAFQDLVAFAGPEMAVRMLKTDEAAKRIFSAHQVDTEGLIKTPEEMQKEINQERMQQMAQDGITSAVPNAVNAAADMAQAAQ